MDSRIPATLDEEMAALSRSADRDSLFMQAKIAVDGRAEPLMVRVRNLSAGGMLAEAKTLVSEGATLVIDLPNVGLIRGRVVWSGDGKFGIAFDVQVNPQSVRRQVVNKTETPAVLSGLHMPRTPYRRR